MGVRASLDDWLDAPIANTAPRKLSMYEVLTGAAS